MVSLLFEDNHCLVVDKPAGLPSQPDDSGDACLVDLVAADLKQRYNKPGNVYVGLVHRLDRPTSGVVLIAKTSKAAARLSAQFHDGIVEKTYLAVVEGHPLIEEGTWVDLLVKDRQRNVVRTVGSNERDSVEARVSFRVVELFDRTTLMELKPLTGRSHQLRVQLASRGLPIIGYRKYGAKSTLIARDGRPRVALHAYQLKFNHPTRGEALEVLAPLPADWPKSRGV